MNTLLDLLLEPLSFVFIQRAIIIAIATGVVCAVLSCYVILKGWALIGDAISHAVLPGLVLAWILGLPLAVGAFLSGIVCTTTTGFITVNSRLKEDTVMGVVFSGMFALGLVLFTLYAPGQHLTHILFGDLLGITKAEFWPTIYIALFVIVFVLFKYKDLMLYCFDPVYLKVIGASVKLLHYYLLLLLAMTIVTALQAVGVVLVIALLIAPGITARLLCVKFSHMLVTSVAVSVLAGISGIYLSYYIDGATGPCIVLVHALFFAAAYCWSLLRQPRKIIGQPVGELVPK